MDDVALLTDAVEYPRQHFGHGLRNLMPLVY